MRNQYFLKDKKALIYKVVKRGSTSFGASSSSKTYLKPTTKKPVWCYSRQLSQDIQYLNYAIDKEETRMFVFNFRSDIAVFDFIFYRDAWYQVTRTDTTDDYNTELFVYVKDLGTGKNPQGIVLNYDDVIPE